MTAYLDNNRASNIKFGRRNDSNPHIKRRKTSFWSAKPLTPWSLQWRGGGWRCLAYVNYFTYFLLGLLRLTSSPIGIMYDSNFIAGTREEVMATYRATCCAPRLSVTAVDANGNVNSYMIDISGESSIFWPPFRIPSSRETWGSSYNPSLTFGSF